MLTTPSDTDAWDARKLEASFADLKTRWELGKIIRPGGVAVELGVANGGFSETLLKKTNISYLYSIDMYADKKHTVEEYCAVIKRLMPYRERNAILKLRFDQALAVFEDETFDFIYVDGYASGGEEDGKTFEDWWPKLKPGAVMGGHDYDSNWPLVIQSVDRFVAKHNLDLFTVGGTKDREDDYNRFASWFVVKPQAAAEAA
ncbi:class I SAM-dependent methyltransferase [Hansschlegelia zhihuaiae]|uniref:Class I SAM-dependent methyltransferase n=1 Tax=Hansschlegelia zhihuaiae TaxID=405005 RepID=A0A4Q0M2E2_9HYPH|nr:class I SAM-dependent methyltransferase [Hansschlegelia zhihuaiae]RXF67021.1 class I SAM-dependent methyltransferase [Hansschlegelia zhihuaiae]